MKVQMGLISFGPIQTSPTNPACAPKTLTFAESNRVCLTHHFHCIVLNLLFESCKHKQHTTRTIFPNSNFKIQIHPFLLSLGISLPHNYSSFSSFSPFLILFPLFSHFSPSFGYFNLSHLQELNLLQICLGIDFFFF
jgi:hypothetical protein